MPNSNSVERLPCIVCDKSFLRRLSPRKGKHMPKNVRNVNCVTCSSKCSKLWNRKIRYKIKEWGGYKYINTTHG
jgi:hypothetical protein